MVGHVVRGIRRHGSTRFVLVGHSMGGKIASLVAARTLDGSSGLFGLAGVVLLAGSPPSPEPMGDDARAQMLSWARAGIAGDGHLATADARTFIDDNVGAPLSPENDDRALSDVLRSAAEAWLAWFERGSREDRAAEVGILDVPALIVAGGPTGPSARRASASTTCRCIRGQRLRCWPVRATCCRSNDPTRWPT